MTSPPRQQAPALNEADLFGPDGRERDRERWLLWLRQYDPDGAAAAIDRLVEAGCDQNQLTTYVMELHATRDWRPVSGRRAQAALGHIRRAATSVRVLADSDLRYFLGEEAEGKGPFRLSEVAGKLDALGHALEKVVPTPRKLVARTTERQSLGRNVLLLHLVRFVRWATSLLHDEDLDYILQTVLDNNKWSTDRWRAYFGAT